MSIQLSSKIQNIKPSATLAVTAKANELREAGHNIIGLGAGEPDFDTPDHIKLAAINAIENGFTKYTAASGIKPLKTAIKNKLSKDNQINYSESQIIVSTGAKQSLYNAMQCLLDQDDEVIIPAPYWVSYPDMALLAEAKPVIIKTDIKNNFKITAEDLEKNITKKTKIVILNSPSNPTGVAYSRKELKSLAKIILDYPNIVVLSDDIYEHILWNETPYYNILNACPELQDRTVIINGVSKAYSMTGWRIGYAAGPSELISAMGKIQGQSTSNPCSIAQKAAIAALNGDQDCTKVMLAEFKKRHDYVVERLNNIPGINCLSGDGAFYAFPSVQQLIDVIPAIKSDVDLSQHLLSEAKVAVVPGTAFGAPGYIRLSFATNMENLKQALDNIEKFAVKYTNLAGE